MNNVSAICEHCGRLDRENPCLQFPHGLVFCQKCEEPMAFIGRMNDENYYQCFTYRCAHG